MNIRSSSYGLIFDIGYQFHRYSKLNEFEIYLYILIVLNANINYIRNLEKNLIKKMNIQTNIKNIPNDVLKNNEIFQRFLYIYLHKNIIKKIMANFEILF